MCNITKTDLEFRLREQARICRQITIRKSVQKDRPDHIANLLEEAANENASLQSKLIIAKQDVNDLNNILRAAGWGQGEIDSTAYWIALQRQWKELDQD